MEQLVDLSEDLFGLPCDIGRGVVGYLPSEIDGRAPGAGLTQARANLLTFDGAHFASPF